jgi:hemerythrin-like domain-containing protein
LSATRIRLPNASHANPETTMNTAPPSTVASPQPAPGPAIDGLDVLDLCHRHMIFNLGKLSALVTRLAFRTDDEARAMAAEVVDFFSTTVRQHHEDEERHLFPRLLAGDDAATVQAILRLQQDHNWLEEDWMEIAPHLAAVASGQSWYDLDFLREGAAVFSALLLDHIALEESCIYPKARQGMLPAERRDVGREMAARRRAERARRSGAAGSSGCGA